MAAFLPPMLKNASTSLAEEPGCERFDVLRAAEPDRIVLYEVYADRAAFEAHCASAHFKSFDHEVGSLVQAKKITELTLIKS